MDILIRISESVLSSARKMLAFFRTHATASVIVFIILAVLLIVWARLGFTLDFNRFFAYETPNCDDQNACTADAPTGCGQYGCTGCSHTPIPNCPHSSCDGNVCSLVDAPGTTTCSTDADCAPPPPASPAPPDDLVGGDPRPPLPAAPASTLPPGISCGYAADVPHDFTWAVLKSTREGGVPYTVQAMAWHSDTAGCAPTTESAIGGAVEYGPWDCGTDLRDNCYAFRWLPATIPHCGRYQLDQSASYIGGGFIPGAGIGVVLNFGVDCGTPTPSTPPATHLECGPANTCEIVPGAGENTCATNADCAPVVSPSTSPSTPPASPSASPSTPPISPSTSPSTPPTSPSTSPSSSPTTLVCSPDNQRAYTGETVSVRANGGTAPYTWTAPGSSFFDPDGDHAAARYNNNGTYEITVRDAAGLTDVCALDINNRPRRRRTPTPDPALEIEKVVRNVTQGISEREAVTARPGDTVEFRIEVSSTGSSTAKAVTVRDTLPDRLTYVTGSTTIDDKTAPDGIIGSGLSLGDMPEDTSKVIRFRATVAGASAFTHTTTILSNFAYARGSNVPEVNDMAHVSVEIGAPVTQIKTGPGESTVLALIIASIITLLYVGYTGTDTFRRRELEENIDIARRDKDGFNFKR